MPTRWNSNGKWNMPAGGAKSKSLEKGKRMVCTPWEVYVAGKSPRGHWICHWCFVSLNSHAGNVGLWMCRRSRSVAGQVVGTPAEITGSLLFWLPGMASCDTSMQCHGVSLNSKQFESPPERNQNLCSMIICLVVFSLYHYLCFVTIPSILIK